MSFIEGVQHKINKDNINQEMENISGYLPDKKAQELTVRFLKQNIRFTVEMLTGIKLFPFQEMLIKIMMNRDNVLLILSRGMSKSFTAAVFCYLQAIFEPGSRIAILSRTFRQQRMILQTIEEFAEKKEATMLRECFTKPPAHKNDEWTINIHKSKIVALPLGDGCVNISTSYTYERNKGFKKFDKYLPKDIDLSVDGQEFTKDGVEVWQNGGWQKSDQQFYNGVKPTKKIRTDKGFEIEATLNHKFKVLDISTNTIVWKKSEFISPGDCILIDKHPVVNDIGNEITKEESYALGCLIGDGCFTMESCVSFATIDEEFIPRLEKGTPFKWGRRDAQHWDGRGGGNGTKYSYMEKFGLTEGKNLRSINKYVPEKIFESSYLADFLSGLFDTDGCVQVQDAKGGTSITISLATTSERLAREVHISLLSFGIVAKKHKRDRVFDKRFGEVNWNTSYEIIITGKDCKIFDEKIGFKLKRKDEKLKSGILSKKRWGSISDDCVYLNKELLISDVGHNKNKNPYNHTGIGHIRQKKYITKDYLKNLIKSYGEDILSKYVELIRDGVFYDIVESSEDSSAPTADIHIPETHEYFCNGFFSHNTKLRGFRFTLIVIDEFLLMPEKIVNEVIMPFLSTNRDPKKRAETIEKENALIKAGKMKEEDRTKFKNPKMVALSSASYKFEFLYKKYSDYINAIQNGYEIDGDTGKKKLLDGTYAVVQLAYDAAPHALYNQALIEQAKREMSAAQFKREFGSQFTDDSGGFYSAKSILACSVPDGEDETVELFGDKNGKYILAVDPSWAENDTSDHFAMVVMKLDTESWNYKPVHFYAVAGGKLKDHIAYFCYILENFNLEFIILDNAGGVTFANALNESEVFKKMKKEVLLISNQDVKLNDKTPDEWETYINEARAQYNKKENRYAYAQVFSPEWIRKINERLQSDIDNRRIKFPAKIEANFGKFENIKNQLIGKNLNSVKFLDAEEIAVSDYDKWEKDSDDEVGAPRNQLAKVVDLIERQDELLELSKRQIASIEARNTDNGGLRFDIPRELKAMKGANRPRKDLYSAILLGSWGVKIYQAIQSLPPDETPDWEPIGFN